MLLIALNEEGRRTFTRHDGSKNCQEIGLKDLHFAAIQQAVGRSVRTHFDTPGHQN
jgi:hypothetical protein